MSEIEKTAILTLLATVVFCLTTLDAYRAGFRRGRAEERERWAKVIPPAPDCAQSDIETWLEEREAELEREASALHSLPDYPESPRRHAEPRYWEGV